MVVCVCVCRNDLVSYEAYARHSWAPFWQGSTMVTLESVAQHGSTSTCGARVQLDCAGGRRRTRTTVCVCVRGSQVRTRARSYVNIYWKTLLFMTF